MSFEFFLRRSSGLALRRTFDETRRSARSSGSELGDLRFRDFSSRFLLTIFLETSSISESVDEFESTEGRLFFVLDSLKRKNILIHS